MGFLPFSHRASRTSSFLKLGWARRSPSQRCVIGADMALKLRHCETIMERRAEFAAKVNLRTHRRIPCGPDKAWEVMRPRAHSQSSPYWYRWEMWLMREFIDILSIQEIHKIFFSPVTRTFKNRSIEEIKALADTIREE